jgi:hypothetical protein
MRRPTGARTKRERTYGKQIELGNDVAGSIRGRNGFRVFKRGTEQAAACTQRKTASTGPVIVKTACLRRSASTTSESGNIVARLSEGFERRGHHQQPL